MKKILIILLALNFSGVAYSFYPIKKSEPLNTVIFGSCNKNKKAQDYWDVLGRENPDLFVWTGDIIYANTTDMSVMKAKYDQLKNSPKYSKFASKTPIIGTWDDHDYGDNNVGGEYPMKVQSQKHFLDFVDEPADSPRRAQKGIYTSYVFGPEGQRVKFLMMDLRYHQEEPGRRADLLGAAQWKWLEEEFAKNDTELTVMVSSLQVAAKVFFHESWSKFPASKKRLFKLVKKYNMRNFFILSGDVHYGVFQTIPRRVFKYWKIWDFTSSGLNNSWMPEVTRRNVAFEERSKRFLADNFGQVDFNWHSGSVEVSVSVKNETGGTEIHRTIKFDLD